jgi:hypothetical protein
MGEMVSFQCRRRGLCTNSMCSPSMATLRQGRCFGHVQLPTGQPLDTAARTHSYRMVY